MKAKYPSRGDRQETRQTRLLMSEQLGDSISWPFLTVLVFWICALFLGFGLFARFNVTVTLALLVGALSVSGAIFLILELSTPYSGFMQLSDAHLRHALTQTYVAVCSLGGTFRREMLGLFWAPHGCFGSMLSKKGLRDGLNDDSC
jgi:hypothetical protein